MAIIRQKTKRQQRTEGIAIVVALAVVAALQVAGVNVFDLLSR